MQAGHHSAMAGSTWNNLFSPVRKPEPGGYTIFVDCNATGANNGTSWENAFTSIQSAVDAAQTGDLIGVRPGRYARFRRSAAISYEVRSTDGAETTIIDGTGFSDCTLLGTRSGTSRGLLNGFTITNHTNSSNEQNSWVYAADMKNCIVTGNAGVSGIRGSDRTGNGYIENCDVYGNTTTRYQLVSGFNDRIVNCRVFGNDVSGRVSVLASIDGKISNTYISDNTLVTGSDSLSCVVYAPGGIYNCTIVPKSNFTGPVFDRAGGAVVANTIAYLPTGCTPYRASKAWHGCIFSRAPDSASGFTVDPSVGADFLFPTKGMAAGDAAYLQTDTDIRGRPWSALPSCGCYQV